jgi:hypothetical protein
VCHGIVLPPGASQNPWCCLDRYFTFRLAGTWQYFITCTAPTSCDVATARAVSAQRHGAGCALLGPSGPPARSDSPVVPSGPLGFSPDPPVAPSGPSSVSWIPCVPSLRDRRRDPPPSPHARWSATTELTRGGAGISFKLMRGGIRRESQTHSHRKHAA